MKKMGLIILLSTLFLGIGIGIKNDTELEGFQEFKIIYSLKHRGGNYEQSTADYVIYLQDYSRENMLKRIYDFHTNMNGIPDKLTINLYNSEEDWENSVCALSKTYFKE